MVRLREMTCWRYGHAKKRPLRDIPRNVGLSPSSPSVPDLRTGDTSVGVLPGRVSLGVPGPVFSLGVI